MNMNMTMNSELLKGSLEMVINSVGSTVYVPISEMVDENGNILENFWMWWKSPTLGFRNKRTLREAGLQPAKVEGRWVVSAR